MRFSKCGLWDLEQALKEINRRFDNNIDFNRFDRQGFTLKVKDSKKAGHKLGYCTTKAGNHRRLINACWHVHGYFFDALFSIRPDAVIYSRGKRITKHYGNWKDSNIGSIAEPMAFSEACDCVSFKGL